MLPSLISSDIFQFGQHGELIGTERWQPVHFAEPEVRAVQQATARETEVARRKPPIPLWVRRRLIQRAGAAQGSTYPRRGLDCVNIRTSVGKVIAMGDQQICAAYV